jgi:hypothetical protein
VVIADVDQSLARFLESALDRQVTITFDAPTHDWAKTVKRPAVSCFLHRIVEDIDRRAADWMDQRSDDGRVTGRQPPVRHYQMHYQVSAWAQTVDAEHRLLGRVMEACLAGETITNDHLAGVLDGEHEPLLVRLAMPLDRPGPQPHEIWSSLGVPLRASLDLTLVVPMRPALITEIAPPAEELSMAMESIGSGPRSDAAARDVLAERRWTAFRIRETSSSDDPGLDGVRHRV